MLLIDDRCADRTIARDLLLSSDYAVVPARSVDEAGELLAASPRRIDLALVAFELLLGDGRAAFGRLRELVPGARIVACSEDADEDDLAAMFADGLSAFIQRPLVRSELQRKLEGALRDWR